MDRALRKTAALLSAALVMVAAASCAEESDSTAPATGESLGYDPQLVAEGQQQFEETCAACHGVDLRGTETGEGYKNSITT